jgi:3-deoxy-D-manno-oct-2-ulosonic acid (Kdo) hydroxylase
LNPDIAKFLTLSEQQQIMGLIEITDYRHPGGWTVRNAAEQARWYCEKLEEGDILCFPDAPFQLPQEDTAFLLSRHHSESAFHKNVSYRPVRDQLRGFSGSTQDLNRVCDIFTRYSREVTRFLCDFLLPYATGWSLDYASFRPYEEEDRTLPLHKRNDLLHVDAFPSRPTAGKRILRIFTNIHPEKPRVWNTGDPFQILAPQLAPEAGLVRIAQKKNALSHRAVRAVMRGLKRAGIPLVDRSAYDAFMLHFHDYLKENENFQRTTSKFEHSFAPHSTWLVFTDTVPHAVLSGQSAVEQTFLISLESLVSQQQAPIRVLERLAGAAMAP